MTFTPARSRASFMFRWGCSKPEPGYLSVPRDEGPTASVGPGSNIQPLGNYLTPKLEYMSATAHLDKALNRLKKVPLWFSLWQNRRWGVRAACKTRPELSGSVIISLPSVQPPQLFSSQGERSITGLIMSDSTLRSDCMAESLTLMLFFLEVVFPAESSAEHSHSALHQQGTLPTLAETQWMCLFQ